MAVVYRYIDLQDEIIKYVGIVWSGNRTLKQRTEEHKNDDWTQGRLWRIEYLQKDITSRTDAEYLEAHYVSKFGTGEYFNKSKSDWGKSELIDDTNDEWLVYHTDESPVSRWEIETTISKIKKIETHPTLCTDEFTTTATYEVCFDDKCLRIVPGYLSPFNKHTGLVTDSGYILLCELRSVYKNPSDFPDVKKEKLPISYRISEVDGETMESVRIGSTTVEVEKRDNGSFYVKSIIETPDEILEYSLTYIDPFRYTSQNRNELLKDLIDASKYQKESVCLPDGPFIMNSLFNNDDCYADVCKRIGDYVISNINQGDLRSHPYLVSQYNHLRKHSEEYAYLSAVEPIIPAPEGNE